MKYLNRFSTQSSAIGKIVLTPQCATLSGSEKMLYIPENFGATASLIAKDDFIDYTERSTIEFIDLGLPSGTKWMKCNIGAEKETDYGLFFQWGDTVGYDKSTAAAHSTWSTCPGNGGASSSDTSALTAWNTANLTNRVLNTNVDAAYIHTNGQAKMPTQSQITELWEYTLQEKSSINGVKGTTFSLGNKYIFIPFAGYFVNGSYYEEGSIGTFWLSQLRNTGGFEAFGYRYNYMAGWDRAYMYNVRGVSI